MAEVQTIHSADRPSTLALAAAVLALVLALALVWQSAKLFQQDLAFTAVETEVSFWGRGDYQPDAKTRARVGKTLEGLLTEVPAHPGYLMLAANYHAWQAYWAESPELEYDFSRRAEAAKNAAKQSRPAHPGNRGQTTQ
tara:strand:+ start:1105 stop:1521 length:417 start_codon:yes stop_codon:yes gene_type:complete